MSSDAPLTLRFDSSTVSLEVLEHATYALNRLMTVEIRHDGDDFVCLLHPRQTGANVAELAHRMRSEVIDQRLRVRLAAQTAPVRDLIFALAFAKTGLVSEEEAETNAADSD